MFELYAKGGYSIKAVRNELIKKGFRTNNGLRPCTAQVELILKNEIYTGVFYYKKKKFENAQHPAIISPSMFRYVQNIMRNPTRTKSRKNLFTYANFLKCGVCGCSLTAEIKKAKYIYYHCTGNKGGICKKDYIRQEEIDSVIEEMLKGLKLSDEKIRKQIDILTNRINQTYMDKLDGRIDETFWQELNSNLQAEKNDLMFELQNHEEADKDFIKNANLVFELAKNAHSIFLRHSTVERQKMLNLICSNFSYKGKELSIELDTPFNTIFEL